MQLAVQISGWVHKPRCYHDKDLSTPLILQIVTVIFNATFLG